MHLKIQSDQPRITRNALKCQTFKILTESSSGHYVHQEAHFRISCYFIF